MSRPRDRRPEPEIRSPEEEAALEARYRQLHRRLKRYWARMQAQDPDRDAPPISNGDSPGA
ncbi:MAG: hypothetical protein K9G59_17820 [Caulobacter sp.]|nr:hypothetical protein [Caulobacter sp.]